jgi:drug/metabolite transporter (DMT)-like permease
MQKQHAWPSKRSIERRQGLPEDACIEAMDAFPEKHMPAQRNGFLRTLYRNETIIGIAAGLAVATTTAIWAVATRAAMTSSLLPHDVTLIRFSVAAFFLWPVFLISLPRYRESKASSLILMLIGAGIPFMWIASTGLTFAPVSHVSTLLTVMMPVFVTIISWVLFREALPKSQIGGIATVLLGVGMIAGSALILDRQADDWIGDLLFLCAAFLFATFTITQRRSGLTPWQGTALVNVGSMILFVPIYLMLPSTGIHDASARELIVQALSQGIGAALLGIYFYTVAVARLGPQRAAIFLALVPPLSTILGAIFLDEHPSGIAIAGIVLVMIGVVAVIFGPKLSFRARAVARQGCP